MPIEEVLLVVLLLAELHNKVGVEAVKQSLDIVSLEVRCPSLFCCLVTLQLTDSLRAALSALPQSRIAALRTLLVASQDIGAGDIRTRLSALLCAR